MSGWEKSTDEQGRTYYVNHETQQTSWNPFVDLPLPHGWEQRKDSEGRVYFFNFEKNFTQWEDPRLSDDYNPSAETNQRQQQQQFSSNNWACSKCTFENDIHATTCDACGCGKDGSPASVSYNAQTSFTGQDNSIDASTAAAIAAAQAEDYAEDWQQDHASISPSELAPHMVPDEHSGVCTLCTRAFDWKSRRRHHCKCCGSLLCHDCSSRKASFSITGQEEQERRVCDLCFDHQSAGDEDCYLRYVGILRDAGPSRSDDHMLALEGIANMIEQLPSALQNTASVAEQAAAMRTLDNVQRCGGAAQLCELLNPTDPPNVQIQSCRIIASMAAVAANSSADSEAPLSRKSLSYEMSEGSMAMSSIQTMLSRSSTPWEAHMHLAHALYLLGDMFQIQEAARKMHLLPPLCEMLLASQETLQSWSTMAISRLVAGNTQNIEAMIEAGGVQALVLLLSSTNISIKEHAADAICAALEETDSTGEHLAIRVRDAMVQNGGTAAAVSLLGSESPTIARTGLKLIQYLSNGQAEVVRASGAVPLVVGLLTSQDNECRAGAAMLLRNVALCSGSGFQEVLNLGGVAMALPLLMVEDVETKANAAALCEVFAGDEQGANLILEANAVPTLVGLLKYPSDNVRAFAAGALGQLMQTNDHSKQAVINAGGVEAFISLENSLDIAVLRQFIGATYSFVSDESLLERLTRRMQPASLAMKLLQILSWRSPTGDYLDQATTEKLLLVVAVLCGARGSDHEDEDPSTLSQEQLAKRSQEKQTRDLVASNGAPLIVPLLGSAHMQPALVLAAFRLLVSVCKSPKGAEGVAKAGGVTAVAGALHDSLQIEGQTLDSMQLVVQLRLYGLTLFGILCGGYSGNETASFVDGVKLGVQATVHVLDDPGTSTTQDKIAIQVAAIRALRNLSYHSGNWEVIASLALPQLIEILLADGSSPELLSDIGLIIANLAKLGKHAEMVLDAGAVFALMGLLSEREDQAVDAGLSTLTALAESSQRCRLAIVEQGAAAKLLHIAEQRPDPFPEAALSCLVSLTKEPANGPKITAEAGATDNLLRLLKCENRKVGALALEVLLAVAKDSDTLWEQLVVNADIDSSIALLKLGPPRVQGLAVSTIATLCGDSPGFALCASPTILEILPTVVGLLSPPDNLGSDKSESPAKEAAAACTLLSNSSSAREGLLSAGVIKALVTLLLRERRLGRPRSATSEHTLTALYKFSQADDLSSERNFVDDTDKPSSSLWEEIKKFGQRRDTIDMVISILDAHIRDATATESGCDRFELCENAIALLGSLPHPLVPNEVTLIGRSARSLNLIMNESAPESLLKTCLTTLSRLSLESSLTPMLVAAGTIRSSSMLLEPLLSSKQVHVDTGIILQAARMIAALVGESSDRSVDDAVIGTKAIPALAILITKTKELFPNPEHASQALTAGLEAISSLAKGGSSVQKAIMTGESGPEVLIALASVVQQFQDKDDEQPNRDDEGDVKLSVKRATHAMLTLSRLATLDDHRMLIIESEPSILNICDQILSLATTDLDVKLITATVQLVSDLGPSVATHMPDIVHPLVDNVLCNDKQSDAWEPCLNALCSIALEVNTAASMLVDHTSLLDHLAKFLEPKDSTEKETLQTSASSLLVSLTVAASPTARANDTIVDSIVSACSAVLLGNKVGSNPVVVTNALVTLNSLCLTSRARSAVRNSQSLLRAIRSIGTSSKSEVYAADVAARLFATLGTGERLVKPANVPSIVNKMPPPPPTNPSGPPPTITPSMRSSSRSNSITSTNSSTSARSLHSPGMTPSTMSMLPPTSMLPPPTTTPSTQLPIYSNSVGSSGFKQTRKTLNSMNSSSNSIDQSSLELAQRLQAEEDRKARQMKTKSISHPSPPPSKWNCPKCTFENAAGIHVCEMCDEKRPGGGGTPSPVGGQLFVRCPSCHSTLSAPAASTRFQCMSCHATSETQSCRV